MFSWYKYLIVSLVFSHLGFWSGSLFLIAPLPDLCPLALFFSLLGTEWKGMVLLIPTGDDDEENDTVYLSWGRCGRVWRCISLLETVW